MEPGISLHAPLEKEHGFASTYPYLISCVGAVCKESLLGAGDKVQ